MIRANSFSWTFVFSLILCIELALMGTSHPIFYLSAKEKQKKTQKQWLIKRKSTIEHHGAVIRGDTTKKDIALVFTGDEFADDAIFIHKVLKEHHVKASFFLTGNFYRNPLYKKYIELLEQGDHYLGAHSDQHLLYCDWKNRDSLLISKDQFMTDLQANFKEIEKFCRPRQQTKIFLPPFEWYNRQISKWCEEIGLILINFTPGTLSHADYTIPSMGQKYVSSDSIYKSILKYENSHLHGLNGFILLMHIGTHPERSDKFYQYLPHLLSYLIDKGYNMKRIDTLLIN